MTITIEQRRARDVRAGDTIRLPRDTRWRFVFHTAAQPREALDYGGMEELLERLDDWYVVIAMLDLPNRLAVRNGKAFLGPNSMKEYDPGDQPELVEVLFVDCLVDVQVVQPSPQAISAAEE